MVGDLHYALRQFDWLVDQAPEYDLVVLAGDHLDIGSAVPLDAQVPVVLAFMAELAGRTRVAASSGNHDLTTRDHNEEKAALWLPAARSSGVITDWDSADIDGLRVTVSPWWDGPMGRVEVDKFLTEAEPTDGRPWLWVYHGPPADSPLSWGGGRSFGDADLNTWIHRLGPTLVMTGHVHQAPFIENGSWHDRIGDTLVLNAGRQPGDMPAHVAVDLSAGTAWWWSYQGEDEITLDGERPTVDR